MDLFSEGLDYWIPHRDDVEEVWIIEAFNTEVNASQNSEEFKQYADELIADFVEFMETEWKKRVEMVATLRDLKSKVRLNRIQCTHIVDIYSTLEFLTLHPENYFATEDVSRDPVTFTIDGDSSASKRKQDIGGDASALLWKQEIDEDDIKDLESCASGLKALFLELNKIMRHGEILVRECSCEDWIGGALTKMTTIPKNDWGIVTPFFHHLQKLEWILNAIGRGIKEFLTFFLGGVVSSPSNFENDFKVFSNLPPNLDIDVEGDRQMLLDDLLEYLSMAPSTEDEKRIESESESEEKQLARFLVWRLQDASLLLADMQSNGSSDVALELTCEAERFGRNKMTLIDILGHGGCSLAVYRKRWLGINVAVKELHSEAAFAKEVGFAGLQHPNIIQVLDHWIGERPDIVMELMDRDLNSFMEKHFKGKCPPLSWALNVMHQLAEALKYLEDNGVTHRDLKSLNVLVRQCPCKEDGCIVIKLADFGTSKFSPAGAELMTVVGTSGYMAPEVPLDGRVSVGYTTAADVFSFAITCSEILTGKTPFKSTGHKLKKDVKEGWRPELSADCPDLLRAYLQRCWALDPKQRPQHFSDICEFLLYCKEKQLRDGLLIDEDDVKVLLTHFGIKWCLSRNSFTGKYPNSPISAVHTCFMNAIHDDTREELKNLTGSEVLVAADFFGRWNCENHDYNKAAKILQRWEGSPASNAEITWRLGYCFELGLGVSQDIGIAVSLYQKACLQDPTDASACVELGRCYAMGRGVEKDLKLASSYWEMARKCEDKPKSIDEQLTILSYAHYENCRKAMQRIRELTATKSGKNLLIPFDVNPDRFTLQREGIWEIAKHTIGMSGLMAASMAALAAGLFTSCNEKGEIRLFTTCGRLLVLILLVSPMGLPTFLEYQKTFSHYGSKDCTTLVILFFIAFVSVVHSKVSEVYRTPETVLEEDCR